LFKQGRIRWLNEEEKKLKKLKKQKEEKEEEDSFAFLQTPFLINYFLKRAFFYTVVSEICTLPNALSIFFCTSSGLTFKTASNSDLSLS